MWSLAFSPTDQVLLSTSSDNTVRLWSVAALSCLRVLEGHQGGVLRGLYIRSGAMALSGDTDGVLRAWDVRSYAEAGAFAAHDDRIWAIAAIDDGERVATGGGDAMICLWKDVTVEEEEKKKREEDVKVEKQQELSNLIRRKKYWRALQVAFELGHVWHRRPPRSAAFAPLALPLFCSPAVVSRRAAMS